MAQKGARFVQIVDPVVLGHGRPAEPPELRKHEPHPVGLLVASAKFPEHRLDDGLLGLHKPIKIKHRTAPLRHESPENCQYRLYWRP